MTETTIDQELIDRAREELPDEGDTIGPRAHTREQARRYAEALQTDQTVVWSRATRWVYIFPGRLVEKAQSKDMLPESWEVVTPDEPESRKSVQRDRGD